MRLRWRAARPAVPRPVLPECHSTLNKDAWDTPRGILLIPGTNPPINNFDLAAQLATRATTDLYWQVRGLVVEQCRGMRRRQPVPSRPASTLLVMKERQCLSHLVSGVLRGVATVLASGTAISLIALSAGVSPALAEPLTETTLPTETEYVPTEEVITEVPTADEVPPQIVPTADEVPPQIQTTVAPQLPLEPTTQAPVVTQETQAPVVTQETQAPIVTQTTQAPVVTQASNRDDDCGARGYGRAGTGDNDGSCADTDADGTGEHDGAHADINPAGVGDDDGADPVKLGGRHDHHSGDH